MLTPNDRASEDIVVYERATLFPLLCTPLNPAPFPATRLFVCLPRHDEGGSCSSILTIASSRARSFDSAINEEGCGSCGDSSVTSGCTIDVLLVPRESGECATACNVTSAADSVISTVCREDTTGIDRGGFCATSGSRSMVAEVVATSNVVPIP